MTYASSKVIFILLPNAQRDVFIQAIHELILLLSVSDAANSKHKAMEEGCVSHNCPGLGAHIQFFASSTNVVGRHELPVQCLTEIFQLLRA